MIGSKNHDSVYIVSEVNSQETNFVYRDDVVISEINQYLLSTFFIERALTTVMLLLEAILNKSILRWIATKWTLVRYGFDSAIAYLSVVYLGIELPVAQFSTLQPTWIALSINVLVLAGVIRIWRGLLSRVETKNVNQASPQEPIERPHMKPMPYLNLSELSSNPALSAPDSNFDARKINAGDTRNSTKWTGFQLGNLSLSRSKS